LKSFFTALAMMLAFSPMAQAIAVGNDMGPNIGTILPSDMRCHLSASAAVIDYGSHSRWQLQDVGGGQQVSPGKRMLMVSVVCPYSQTMRVMLRGDRASNGNLRYGDRGNVTMRLLDAQLDGQNIPVATTTADGRVSGAAETSMSLQPGNGIVAMHNGQPAKGKTFTARIQLEPVMPESDARISARQITESSLDLDLMD